MLNVMQIRGVVSGGERRTANDAQRIRRNKRRWRAYRQQHFYHWTGLTENQCQCLAVISN